MTHFGIICPSAAGHLNPMITLCHELKQRGHRLTIIGIADIRSQVLAAEFEFQTIGQSDFPPGAIADIFTRLGKLQGWAAIGYSVKWMATTARTILQDAPEAIKTAGIEALLIDQASPEGGTVAEYLRLPYISICNALMLNHDANIPPFVTTWQYNPSWWGRLRNQLGYRLLAQIARPVTQVVLTYRQRWNLPLDRGGYSQLAQISQQPSLFEFPRTELPACFHFTSSFSNLATRTPTSFPYEKLTGQHLIYASLGTLQNRLTWIFKAIAEACVELDVQLIIALGGGTNPDALEIPGNAIVVGYAPQLELLQRADLTITHAGMNTVLESLKNGVPMVAIPITNDQPGVAARIAWTGVGEVIPLKKVKTERLRRAIVRVLKDDSYRQNAQKIQQVMIGGVSKAADIIEQVVATGKPVIARADS